ncbi:hypothetical protein Tco_0749204 [Tanacetum coccineum]|uniref:Uncharacterized protein n=1 Tax=Tanacetum coccineum TaxID=301880 RepID=A0ABQ4YXQ2_9ASTR
MSTLKFAETHNLVAFLEKPKESNGFEEIIDFLNTINGECQIQALVDKKVIIIKTSIRSDLKLDDAEGTDCLPTATIFAELKRIGFEMESLKEKSKGLEKRRSQDPREVTWWMRLQRRLNDDTPRCMILIVVGRAGKRFALDEEIARNLEAQLQAELIKEERIARQKEEEASIALLESWDNTQAMMDANFQLAQQMQTEEQE